MKAITLSTGEQTFIDDSDFELVCKYSWHSIYSHETVYARAEINGKLVSLHQLLFGKGADHVDRNGLNNQRNNLRAATVSQNNANRKLPKINTSGYRGVYWCKQRAKWKATISVAGRKCKLGSF